MIGLTALFMFSFGGDKSPLQAIIQNVISPSDGDRVTTPDLPDQPDRVESDFSMMLNEMIESPELSFSDIQLEILTPAGDPVKINLVDVILNKEGHNALDYDLVAHLSLEYKNIKAGPIDFSFDENLNAYLAYKTKRYSVKLPKTLAGLIDVIRAFDLNLSSGLGSAGDFSFEWIRDALEAIQMGKEEEVQAYGEGWAYRLSIPEIKIGQNTNIDPFSVVIRSDKNNHFTGLSIEGLRVKSGADVYEVRLSSNGSLTKNTFEEIDSSTYQDLTDPTNSIFETLIKIGNEKKTDINIDIDLKDNSVSGAKTSSIRGLLQADISDVFANASKGRYRLSMEHKNASNTLLNDIEVRYQNENCYLNFNDSFKGKIKDADFTSIFDYISGVSGQKAYAGLNDILNKVLVNTPFDDLMGGDLSKFDELGLSFDYNPSDSFRLTLDSTFFGLNSGLIDFYVHFDTDENGKENKVKDLAVSGLSFGDVAMNIKLSFADYTEIPSMTEEEMKSYTDFHPIVPLFTTLGDMIGEKKLKASYSLAVKDMTTGHGSYVGGSYSAHGSIAADMSQITADKNFSFLTVDDYTAYYGRGKYGLTMALTTGSIDSEGLLTEHGLEHDVGLYYQDHNIYLGYNYDQDESDYVLHTSLQDSQFGQILDVIDRNTTKGASRSLISSSGLLSEIQNTENFKKLKESLKNFSLIELGKFVHILNDDEENLVIDVDPKYLLEGTSYADKLLKIALSFNAKENVFNSISLYAKFSAESTLDLKITFDEYQDNFLTEEQKQRYTPLNHASQLLSTFFTLPSQFEKFGLKVSGKVNDGVKDIVSIGSAEEPSMIGVDVTNLNDPKAYGALKIHHPFIGNAAETATQNLEFTYAGNFDPENLTFSDHTFVLEYNDNMHIDLKKSNIEEIASQIKRVDEDNLLYRYLGNLMKGSTGMPIMDFISTKDPTILLSQKYIEKIEFGDQMIRLQVSAKLFNAGDNSGASEVITIYYDDTGITRAEINGVYNGKNIEASMEFVSFDTVPYPEMNPDGFIVDMSGFATLLKCLIDTTMKNYFYLSGTIKVPVGLFGESFKISAIECYCEGKVLVEDNTAYAYVVFHQGVTSKPDLSSNDFKCVELFVMEEQIQICQTVRSKEWTKQYISSTVFKTTKQNFMDFLVYYLMSVFLNVDAINFGTLVAASIYEQVYPASGQTETQTIISNDFSKLLTRAEVSGNTFNLTVSYTELNNVLNISPAVFAEDLVVSMTFDDSDPTYQPLTHLILETRLDVASVVKIPATLDFSMSQGKITLNDAMMQDGYMKRYGDFISAMSELYGAYSDTSTLPFYEIDKITISGTLMKKYSLTDNASSAKKSRKITFSSLSEQSALERAMYYSE